MAPRVVERLQNTAGRVDSGRTRSMLKRQHGRSRNNFDFLGIGKLALFCCCAYALGNT
jgi:hypothetical protein